MKTTRGFIRGERYQFDQELSVAKGWAQVDSCQDASYYGCWAHPIELKIFSFTEGDTMLFEAETVDEFVAELRHMDEFERRMSGLKGIRIDAGFNAASAEPFIAMGLSDLIH